jgi:hypothetical protein
MKIIGLSGYARSGKDEAAKALGELDYQRISFADKLRDFLYALDPPLIAWMDQSVSGIKVQKTLREVIDEFGWDGYKDTHYVSVIRPLLQRLGTEAGRQVLWDSIWIDAALHDLDENGKYVITDARFPNEANAVAKYGGSVWRIERAGNGPAVLPDGSIHSSETSLDDYPFDLTLHNNGTLEQFHEAVKAAEADFEGIPQAPVVKGQNFGQCLQPESDQILEEQ